MHADQLTVTVPVVGALVATQFPAWADLPVRELGTAGTVNALFRLGKGLVARFPLRPGDPETMRLDLEREASAARELHGRTPFATPEPVALGRPGPGFAFPWSVQTWLPGRTADDIDPASSTAFADDLADFILAVRALDRRGRPFAGRGRGGDLRTHDGWVRTCLERSAGLLEVDRLRALWARMRNLPRTADDVMTHGDLIPANVLVSPGRRLAGVLDVGGLGPADPALDLVAAWHLLDSGPRVILRRRLGCDDLEWERGRAWAFEQALGAGWYYVDSNPPMSRMARRTLARILDDSTG